MGKRILTICRHYSLIYFALLGTAEWVLYYLIHMYNAEYLCPCRSEIEREGAEQRC